jgi:hypothetical protein
MSSQTQCDHGHSNQDHSNHGHSNQDQSAAAQQQAVSPGQEQVIPLYPAAALFEDFEVPWWLTEEFCGSVETEEAAWLAGLPGEVREEYERGPYTGEGEAIPPGFTHHDRDDDRCGAGFAAGGANDTALPGPALASALQTAAGGPLTGGGRHGELGESELIGVLCGWRRLTSWAQAGEAAAAHALAARRAEQARDRKNRQLAEHTADEVAAALRLSAGHADRLLEVAAGLARIPEVHAALEAGLIDYPRACAFVDLLAGLADEKAREIARRLLAGEVAAQTCGRLRRRLEREAFDADPDAAQARRQEAHKLTRVDKWAEPSGNGVLAGRELDPADVITIDKQLTATAEWLQSQGAPGTIRELRSAAFTALLVGRELATLLPDDAPLPTDAPLPSDDAAPDDFIPPDDTPLPTDTRPVPRGGTGPVPPGDTGRGPGPADAADSGQSRRAGRAGWPRLAGIVNLTMPISTWAGLAPRAGEVAGYGTVDASTCTRLAAMMGPATRWCLTLTDEHGRPVAHGCARGAGPPPGQPAIRWAIELRDKLQHLQTGTCRHPRRSGGYRPPSTLAHLVQIRQRTCSFPSCSRAAVRCDLDHTRAYGNGGITCECNLAPLCRRHHRAKQAPGWHLEQAQPGHMTWHLPHQRSYQTSGDPYPV